MRDFAILSICTLLTAGLVVGCATGGGASDEDLIISALNTIKAGFEGGDAALMGEAISDDFDHYEFEFADSAKRYDSGSYNLAGIYGLGGAIELIQEIGIEAIATRLLELTDRLAEGVREKGYRVVSSRQPSEASGIIAFFSDVHDPNEVRRDLQDEHRIVVAVRSGRLRASPYVYNTEREIDQLIETLPRH